MLLVVEMDTPYTSILLAAELEIKTKAQRFRYRSWLSEPVLRIRIHRIHMFLGLPDPDPDPLVGGMDPDPDPALDPDPDPSIIIQK